jgi:hypothetical protein
MDDGDISIARQEIENRLLSKALKERHTREVEPTGKCLYCAKDLEKPKRWCDRDCLHDWQRYIKRS